MTQPTGTSPSLREVLALKKRERERERKRKRDLSVNPN